MAARPALLSPDRPTLVGVRPLDPAQRIRAGAHLLKTGAEATAAHDEGYLTSVVYSPMLESWIGLAMLNNGPERHGEHMRAHDPVRNGDTAIEIVSPMFFDPDGARLHV
jgi:sarcosine oxidase subunit alpha